MSRRAVVAGVGRALAAALLATGLGAATLTAQPNATVRAGAARPQNASRALSADTLTSSFEVAGVRVILRRITANDVVAANLYLLGGTRQITPATAGIETLLLAASERGTRRFSKQALRRTTARLGTEFSIEPAEDYTMFGLRAIRSAFDSSWAILADRVMAPTLDSTEVELVRTQLLSGARQNRDTPDALVNALADSLANAGHPYALEPTGTERSLAALTLRDLRRYQREQTVTSRMLLVVVGNVDRAHVERLVRRTLGTLPKGRYVWTPPPPPARRPARLAAAHRELPTNYILGYYAGPPAASPDYPVLRVATAVLAGRLFSEIRSRRNLSYAVEAPLIERAAAAGALYVTTVSPDTTLALMHHEIERLKVETLDPEGLEQLVGQFLTEFFLKNETNAAQANFLAQAAILQGDHRRAARFVDELRAVTPADVQRVAREYMRDVQFGYVGDTTRISRGVVARF